MNEEISMAFAGCGFLALYYSGVVSCMNKYVPQLKFKHISGASAGAFAACGILCDVEPEAFIDSMCEMIGSARKRLLGPFSPTYNISKALRKQLSNLYPEDAHIRVSGRLRVSLTRVSDRKNVLVDQFDTKEELIDCLLASSFIPMFSGMIPPKFRDVWYVDGMFSDNLPSCVGHTITVSPFCGETDICPRYEAMPFFHLTVSNTSFAVSVPNLLNLRSIFWPPTAKALEALSKQGFEDTLRYLYKNKYVNCERCSPAETNRANSPELDSNANRAVSPQLDSEPHCKPCENSLQKAITEGLPDSVIAAFQLYVNSEN